MDLKERHTKAVARLALIKERIEGLTQEAKRLTKIIKDYESLISKAEQIDAIDQDQKEVGT